MIGRGHDVGFQSAVAAIIDGMELEGGRHLGPSADFDSKEDLHDAQ
jgi:hypothetical protein